jgi:hypothetical protein
MNALRQQLSRRLAALGVEERPWPGRDDGFAGLFYRGKEFAHFHSWSEIDIRLGQRTIAREGLVRAPTSTVHPGRSATSPWYEMAIGSAADVEEVVRLVGIAVAELERKR